MKTEYSSIIISVINLIILSSILVAIYKAVQGFKSFANRIKEIEKKIDIIQKELENKEHNWYL